MISEYYLMEQMVKYEPKSRKLLPSRKTTKSDEISAEKRTRGNTLFSLRRLSQAVEFYSEAVFHALSESLLSLAAANRSAVLFELCLYQECLQDIDFAICMGYEARLIHKLFLRRVRCYLCLGDLSSCRRALADCHKLAQSQAGFCDDKFHASLSSLERQLATVSVDGAGDNGGEGCRVKPSLSAGTADDLAYASSLIQLRRSEEAGRFVVAARAIRPGDTLFVEQPFGCVLLPDRRLDFCHHCIRYTLALIPCEQCVDVGFCSDLCRREARFYHRYECGYADFLESFGIGRLALRVLLTAGLGRVEKLWRLLADGAASDACSEHCQCHSSVTRIDSLKQEDKQEEQKEDRQQHRRQEDDQAETGVGRFLAVFHLVTNLELCDKHDLIEYCRAALTLYSYLRERTEFFSDSVARTAPPGVDERNCTGSVPRLWSAALLLRHTLQLIANAHALTHVLPCTSVGSVAAPSRGRGVTGDVTQCRVATGVYPSASYMNHACKPSIINSFLGNTLVVRAIERLSPGQQVFHCYGAHYARQSTSERQTLLWQQYRFKCSCPYCSDQQLVNTLERMDGMLCQRCDGGILIQNNNNKNKRDVFKCSQCDVTVCCGQSANAVQQIIDQLQSDTVLSVDTLLSLRERLVSLVVDSHYCLSRLDDLLARQCTESGMVSEALVYLNRCVDRVRQRYGEFSVELGHLLVTRFDLLRLRLEQDDLDPNERGDVRKQSLLVAEQAHQILSLHYGEWSDSCKQMERLTRHL